MLSYRRSNGNKIRFKDTASLIKKLSSSKSKLKRWRLITSIAALSHDLGHGPFSHLLEESKLLSPKDLLKSFDKLKASQSGHLIFRSFLNSQYGERTKLIKDKKVNHEHMSILILGILFHELSATSKNFFGPKNLTLICAMISKDFRKFVLNGKDHQGNIDESLKLKKEERLLLILFSSLISGFVDVDRLDYIRRDSYFAGVTYGSVEHIRLIKSLIPILTLKGEEEGSAFICKLNDAHTLDHFLVGLYETYTQIIYHPKNIQFSNEMIEFLKQIKTSKKLFNKLFRETKDNLIEWYLRTFDTDLVRILEKENIKNIDNCIVTKILERRYVDRPFKIVMSLPEQVETPTELIEMGYEQIETKPRDLVKDSNEIYLYTDTGKRIQFFEWAIHSLVASKLINQKFKPVVWWKSKKFKDDLRELEKRFPKDSRIVKKKKIA